MEACTQDTVNTTADIVKVVIYNCQMFMKLVPAGVVVIGEVVVVIVAPEWQGQTL